MRLCECVFVSVCVRVSVCVHSPKFSFTKRTIEITEVSFQAFVVCSWWRERRGEGGGKENV